MASANLCVLRVSAFNLASVITGLPNTAENLRFKA